MDMICVHKLKDHYWWCWWMSFCFCHLIPVEGTAGDDSNRYLKEDADSSNGWMLLLVTMVVIEIKTDFDERTTTNIWYSRQCSSTGKVSMSGVKNRDSLACWIVSKWLNAFIGEENESTISHINTQQCAHMTILWLYYDCDKFLVFGKWRTAHTVSNRQN